MRSYEHQAKMMAYCDTVRTRKPDLRKRNGSSTTTRGYSTIVYTDHYLSTFERHKTRTINNLPRNITTRDTFPSLISFRILMRMRFVMPNDHPLMFCIPKFGLPESPLKTAADKKPTAQRNRCRIRLRKR